MKDNEIYEAIDELGSGVHLDELVEYFGGESTRVLRAALVHLVKTDAWST